MGFFTKIFSAPATLFQAVTKPIIEETVYMASPMVSFIPVLPPLSSVTATKNMETIAEMFETFNVTAQEMIHMNAEYLTTIQRLSDDIGTMADRIGDMADKIVDTQVIQSPNFLSTQANALAIMGVINNSHVSSQTSINSDIFSGLISTVQTSITLPSITVPTLPTIVLPESSIATMFISFSEMMKSMIDLNAQYLNTIIKLSNDVGKMTFRIGEMSDRIVDTMALQSDNFSATLSNASALTSTPTGVTQTSVEQSTSNTTLENTTVAQQPSQAKSVSLIDSMSTSFYSLVDGITSSSQTSGDSLSGIVAMFNAANDIVRTMIEMNTQFLKTVLVFSDEIGVMADRIGEMADQIVQIQDDLSPAFVASQEAVLGTPIDNTADAVFASTNEGLQTISDSMIIALSGIQGGSNALVAPVDMSLIGEMTVGFVSMLQGISTSSLSDVNMDNIAVMFETANETVRLMMGMNDEYMSAILRLSDDIGTMADRIDVMADRIVETQVIQSENFLATQENTLTFLDLMETSSSIDGLTSSVTSDNMATAQATYDSASQPNVSYEYTAYNDATVAVVIPPSYDVVI
jgi:hypothetical protein